MAFTYFFRDIDTLDVLCDYTLRDFRTRSKINIWDAGCAMGPEPFSLAILMREKMGAMTYRNVKIYSTDIDESNLFAEVIKNATYPWEQVKRIPESILGQYFEKDETVGYVLSEEIRNRIIYSKHNLLHLKPIRSEFCAIVCKNVLLHFKEKERIEVLHMFYESLSEGGYLTTEQTQELPEECSKMFQQVDPNARVYRKL